MLRLATGRLKKFTGNLNFYLELDKDAEKVGGKWVTSMRSATLKRLLKDVDDIGGLAKLATDLVEAEVTRDQKKMSK